MDGNRRSAWKERAYLAPTSSRRQFRWKASALRSLEHLHRTPVTGKPVTVLVPALYNLLPGESIALGWLNEIDVLRSIRQRIGAAAKLTGWDVFTFHTQHNLDSYFNSNIAVLRDTWLHEGTLNPDSVSQSIRRFGKPYEYHRVHARLVENLVFQSSMMEWLTAHAAGAPVRFHVVGTALLSALVWSKALLFDHAVRAAAMIGTRWDEAINTLAEDDLRHTQTTQTDENLGWMRFHRVKQILEGKSALSFVVAPEDLPLVEAPIRQFWFSPTASDEPVLIHTLKDVRNAMEALNLSSWAPQAPKALDGDAIRGWLISALHPLASNCRWSVYNYLLATPASGLMFLNHIAQLGCIPSGADTQTAPVKTGRARGVEMIRGT